MVMTLGAELHPLQVYLYENAAVYSFIIKGLEGGEDRIRSDARPLAPIRSGSAGRTDGVKPDLAIAGVCAMNRPISVTL